MKKIYTLIILILLISCQEPEPKFIGQEIIDGKVSATENGVKGRLYIAPILPKIWVQSPTITKKVNIPFEYEGKWKVGDSCLLIIEKYQTITE